MKTSQVIKKIDLCKPTPAINLAEQQEIGQIIEKAANSKRRYLHTNFMEEVEGELPKVAPTEILCPIF